MPLRSANKAAVRGVCCWRFVRLETGTGAAGTRSRRPHAVRRAYICARFRSVLLAPSEEPRASSLPSSPFLLPQVRPLATTWPFHLISSFTFARLRGFYLTSSHFSNPLWPDLSVPLSCVPIAPLRFLLRRDRPRGYLSRVFSATGTAGWCCVLMFGRTGEKGTRKMNDAGRNDWSVYLWDLSSFLVLLASRSRSIRLFAIVAL